MYYHVFRFIRQLKSVHIILILLHAQVKIERLTYVYYGSIKLITFFEDFMTIDHSLLFLLQLQYLIVFYC